MKLTRIFFYITLLIIVVYDIYAAISDEVKTISSTALYYAQHGHFWLPFSLGWLMCHLFIPWKAKNKVFMFFFIPLAVAVPILNFLFLWKGIQITFFNSFPILAFFIGMPVGLMWQQKQKLY